MLTKRGKTMKNTLTPAVLCLLAVCVAARAQDGPKLVGEKEIMRLDDKIVYRMFPGASCMRLSPDGRRVLYIRKKEYKTTLPNGAVRSRNGYKLVLRDLKTGKDTPVPVPALFGRNSAGMWLTMTVFDPAGKTLVVPVGQDADKNGYTDIRPPKREKSKPGLYDIASGKLKTLDLEADVIFPIFSPNGKMLVVMAMDFEDIEDVRMKPKVHVTPTDKINFRVLSKQGLIRSICPTSNLMAMVLMPSGVDLRDAKFVLYDLKADTVKAELAEGEHATGVFLYNPQWTGDGRYLYYFGTVDEQVEGETRSRPVTRIWDAKLGKKAGVLANTLAIGPGPGKNTMVLIKGKGREQEIVLHAQGDKKLGKGLHSIGDKSTFPISTQGKWLLFIRQDDDGTRTACMAEIALPKK